MAEIHSAVVRLQRCIQKYAEKNAGRLRTVHPHEPVQQRLLVGRVLDTDHDSLSFDGEIAYPVP